MQIEKMIRVVQAKLGVAVDGRAGPQTRSAIYNCIIDRASPPDVALTAPTCVARRLSVCCTPLSRRMREHCISRPANTI